MSSVSSAGGVQTTQGTRDELLIAKDKSGYCIWDPEEVMTVQDELRLLSVVELLSLESPADKN